MPNDTFRQMDQEASHSVRLYLYDQPSVKFGLTEGITPGYDRYLPYHLYKFM